MCGIAGILHYRATASGSMPSSDELFRMRDAMRPRGPDGKGEWFSPDRRVALGHRRLAIIDLSERAAQPMASADGQYVITFNGEIYNHRALRGQLEKAGCRFQTESDTEVLLQLFARKGERMLNDLRGMFAFSIWDERKRRLFLARDGYGIKPLYYADDGRTFRFASQVKALLAGRQISSELEPAGLAGFFIFGSVPEPWTSYRHIRALPAGSYAWVGESGMSSPRQWFSIAEVWRSASEATPPNTEDAPAAIREALLDSVRSHLVADVPVGAFLSAGVDSGALVGLMRDAGQQEIQTVTLAFDEFSGGANDESPLAAEVARHYGVQHQIRRVTEDEFQEDLPKILQAMDQPSIDGINTWFVSKAARELGLKVAISGLGGDELLGGYPSFSDIPRWVQRTNTIARLPGAKALFSGSMAALYRSPLSRLKPLAQHPKLKGIMRHAGTYAGAYLVRRGIYLPEELKPLEFGELLREGIERLRPTELVEEALQPDPQTTFGKVAALEASLYMRNQLLRDSDWASMAHSLEVRVPLVDTVLLHRLAPLLVKGKENGKECLGLAPNRPLPGSVIHRPKTGFTTPIAKWLKRSELWQERAIPAGLMNNRTPWARQWAHWVAHEVAA